MAGRHVVRKGVIGLHFIKPHIKPSYGARLINLKLRAQLNAKHDNPMLAGNAKRPDLFRPLTADTEHIDGSLVELDENTIVNLPQAEQLKNLLYFWSHLVNTTNPHYKSKLWICRDIVIALFPCLSPQPN